MVTLRRKICPCDLWTDTYTYCAHEHAPKLLDDAALKHTDMIIPWAWDDNKLLGLPFCMENSLWNQIERIQRSMPDMLPVLAQIDDGLICLYLLRISVHMLACHLTLSRSCTLAVDHAILSAHGKCVGSEGGSEVGRNVLGLRMDLKLPLNMLVHGFNGAFRSVWGIRGVWFRNACSYSCIFRNTLIF